MLLALAFFATAAIYASVGFGGGSTYSALLVLSGVDYRFMPVIALVCNLIVVAGGTLRFALAGHLRLRQAIPWATGSVPAAWAGGFLAVSERVFTGTLGFTLFAAGVCLLARFKTPEDVPASSPSAQKTPVLYPFLAGAGLGFLAGVSGIGGGIFLAPLLYLLRWGNGRAVAAQCSFFILVNSAAGLAGHATKLEGGVFSAAAWKHWALFVAVLAGGQIGAFLAVRRFSPDTLRVATALLVLYAGGRMILRWWSLG